MHMYTCTHTYTHTHMHIHTHTHTHTHAHAHTRTITKKLREGRIGLKGGGNIKEGRKKGRRKSSGKVNFLVYIDDKFPWVFSMYVHTIYSDYIHLHLASSW